MAQIQVGYLEHPLFKNGIGIKLEQNKIKLSFGKNAKHISGKDVLIEDTWSYNLNGANNWYGFIFTYDGSQTTNGFKFYRLDLESSSSNKFTSSDVTNDFTYLKSPYSSIPQLSNNGSFDDNFHFAYGYANEPKFKGIVDLFGITSKLLTDQDEIEQFALQPKQWILDQHGNEDSLVTTVITLLIKVLTHGMEKRVKTVMRTQKFGYLRNKLAKKLRVKTTILAYKVSKIPIILIF